MVAVPSLDVSAADAKQAFIAEELAKLTPEEREEYESSSFFRGIVDLTLEQEWEHPGPTEAEREAAEKYGGDPIRCFVEQFIAFVLERHPAEEATRIAAIRADLYGADVAREAAAIQDGTHPIQQLR